MAPPDSRRDSRTSPQSDRPAREHLPTLAVPLIQRRIGLLFAGFLALLVLAGLKTAWLGTVKASSLKHAATTQQVEEVSDPADDVAVTPYLVKDPARAAKLLAPLLGSSEDDVLRRLARRDTGFVYL